MPFSADRELNTEGLYCPEPVMLLHNSIRDMVVGDTVYVIATDPSTVRDIPKFCTFLGHKLLEIKTEGEFFYYLIEKR